MGHFHATFPYKEILSFFGQCHVSSPCMEALSFFGRFGQKVVIFPSDSFDQKRLNNQMAAVMLQVIRRFHAMFSKNSFFISANTYKKHCEQKSSAQPLTMPRCAFYPNADFAFRCCVTLKSCYKNSNFCVPHINTWTVSVHCLEIDSVEIMLSSVVKCVS